MPNQTLNLQNILVEFLSSKGYSLMQNRAQRWRGRTLVFCHHDSRIWCGKRQGWLSWAKRHWGWSPYMDVNVWNNHVAGHLLFTGIIYMAFPPCLYELVLCCFPHLCKQGMVMPNLPSTERRTRLKCLLCNGNSLYITRALRQRGTNFFLQCPKYRRSLGLTKA